MSPNLLDHYSYPKDDFLAAYYAKIYLDTMGIEKNGAAYHNTLDVYETHFARLSKQEQQKLADSVTDYLATHTVRDL